MKNLLTDKDIIIAILALSTPVLAFLEIVIKFYMECKQKKKERNYSHRDGIYTKFLDLVNELVLNELKLYDDQYYATLIHSLNEALLYAGKETRKHVKSLKEYMNKCKENFLKEFKNQGYDNKYEYIREIAENYNINGIEAEIEYDKNLESLKLAHISKTEVKNILERIIDSMSEELLMDK